MSRDILAPPLQRMSHNRMYRVNITHEDFGGDKTNAGKRGSQAKEYLETDLYAEDDFDDEATCKIVELPNNEGYKLPLHIPKAFYGGLIGMKGNTKRRIENETQTEISVPRPNDKSSELLIRGKERSSLCAALRKIRLIVESLRKKMRPTHFLAVSLNSGIVQEKFLALKQSILEAEFPGIDSDLFISERCIHLTLGVYVLLDDEERQKALEQLQLCRQYLTELSTPLQLKVSGLEIMNDDPSSTRVLYARVEAPDLQHFADRCLQHFKPSGLCATDNIERDSIKLHMTIMNNRKRKELNAKSPNSFDAREILKKFGDYDFGIVHCNEVHLCVLKSSQEVEDFYKITGSLKF
ncbi:activating signal cointegrator 1 complex subunit 1 [Scaptodrosophila lebanonensis]|uniref:Activating signal cointegrator 1 complex subunit 1 n=1 Tax=Drosophila lebanonensis TaxID=7225 RepID=A0A6J2UHQ2_DROLE|nr:activating signal cointegrator 1 complex subunit 1 [Scaptodrosophila lebanonensis]